MAALGNIVRTLFDDMISSPRMRMGGIDVEQGMLERLKRPELVIGPEGVANMIGRADDATKKLLEEEQTIAYRMLEQGESNQDIEARTGFFFDDDGAIRREIDDNKAKLKKSVTELDKLGSYKMEEIFDHPDFFNIYPQLRNSKVQFYKGKDPNSKGFFDVENNAIGININSPAWKNRQDDDATKVIRTILHESQHMIQNIEGLQPGANPAMFERGGSAGMNLSSDAAYKRYLKIIGEAEARNVEMRFGKKNARDFIKTLFTDERSKAAGLTRRDAIKSSGEKVLRVYDQGMEPEVEDLNARPFAMDATLRGM